MRYVISAPNEHFLDRSAPASPALTPRRPVTAYEAAVIVQAATGDPELMGVIWPGHPSGLSFVNRAVLGYIAGRQVWRDRRGDYFMPDGRFGKPRVLAFLHAGLVKYEHGYIDEHGNLVTGVVLTELGQQVIDGTFVAKAPDLLDMLAGAA